MERPTIPNPVIAVVGEVLGNHYYSHSKLETLFMEHGAPGDPPPGNCVTKCTEWLKRCNADPEVDPFSVLGGVLEDFMEVEIPAYGYERWQTERERVRKTLARYNLSYHQGGQIIGAGLSLPSRSLRELFAARDLAGVEAEFQRALATIESDPAAGATAACSLIESLCKIYIEDEGLELPSEQTIRDLWKVVRKHLGFDPGDVVDQDLVRILSGTISVVDGVGSLRTHASSAHGRGRAARQLKPREARLAVHAAHTLAVFIIESWEAKESVPGTKGTG